MESLHQILFSGTLPSQINFFDKNAAVDLLMIVPFWIHLQTLLWTQKSWSGDVRVKNIACCQLSSKQIPSGCLFNRCSLPCPHQLLAVSWTVDRLISPPTSKKSTYLEEICFTYWGFPSSVSLWSTALRSWGLPWGEITWLTPGFNLCIPEFLPHIKTISRLPEAC